MNRQKLQGLVGGPALAAVGLWLLLFSLSRGSPESIASGLQSLVQGSSACDTLTDIRERRLCRFVTGVYPDGLLTNWRNPRLPDHYDHAPMRDYGEVITSISESSSMLALYAALVGDQTTLDYLCDVSAPVEVGGTGAPMSSTQESPYYFGAPNLCLLHWVLDERGYKEDGGTDWLASAGGEASRWLEALSIADRRFPREEYRLFANCLAWGMMGATDSDARAVGHFEDPGTPDVAFDDYLMRPYFGWRGDFDGFAAGTSANLSYNNMMGWHYAAQLGQVAHALHQTTEGAGGTETIVVRPQAVGSIRIDMTGRGSDLGYSLVEVEAHNPFTSANLLLGADCRPSSYQDDGDCLACTCEKALDGDSSTLWSSELPDSPGGPLAPQWLVITPTAPTRVTEITLHWGGAYAQGYSLAASWPFADFYSNVLSHTASLMAGSIQHCGTDLPRVMYDVGHHFYYPEILTPNLACEMTVSAIASSIEATHLPANAVDCDPNTRWSSDFADDEWIALEFGRPVTIDGAILRWERAYGKAYTVDVSDDGMIWTPVYTETNDYGGTDVIQFPELTTRYVRMRGQVRGTGWGYSLYEFEVYHGGGTSSLTALDLARRAAVYGRLSGDAVLLDMGRRILNFYKSRYPSIAAAYDPCTGDPFPGWENGEWPSIMANLAELAAAYCDVGFARQVIEEKTYPKLMANPTDPLYGTVGASAFENLEVMLALRHIDQSQCIYLPILLRSGQCGDPKNLSRYRGALQCHY